MAKRFSNVDEHEFNKIKELLKQGLTFSQVGVATKRTLTTVSIMGYCDSFQEYRQLITDINNWYKATRSIRKAGKTPQTPNPLDVHILKHKQRTASANKQTAPATTPPISDELEQAVVALDNLFNDLKEQIVKVVDISAREQNKTVLAEKDQIIREQKAEIASMKAVVEAAKSSNLVDNLKRRLMGA